jgi:hypothetical protein
MRTNGEGHHHPGIDQPAETQCQPGRQIVALPEARMTRTPTSSSRETGVHLCCPGSSSPPKALGALLSHFENKVIFQGFVWNLNSFDQEGVHWGKCCQNVLSGFKGDPVLKAVSDLL